jgi:hypothetical protein
MKIVAVALFASNGVGGFGIGFVSRLTMDTLTADTSSKSKHALRTESSLLLLTP